jgi:flagellar hook-associated protein 1 FlgK
MSNLFSSINSAAGAMRTYEKAMEVVQNDTVNANTPGYVRQTVAFQSKPFDLNGAQPGGVAINQVISSRDEYAEHNVQLQQTAVGKSSTLASHLSQIEPVFDLQSTTGVAGSLNSLFSAFSQLTINPNDSQLRQSVINAASRLSDSFNVAANQLNTAGQTIDSDMQNAVAGVNTILGDIQQINVALRRNSETGLDPSVDTRLHVDLENLSQYADITSIRAQDGSISVFLGGQRPLVVGTTQYPLTASTGGPTTAILDSSGNDVSSYISGGQLGASLEIKNTLIPGYLSQLDQLAKGISDTINAQLAAGVDQSNSAGAPLFQYNPAAAAKTLNVTAITASQLAAASLTSPGGNDNAMALSGLQNSNVGSLGGFTFLQFYSNLASTVGRDVSNASDDSTTQQQLLAQAQSLRSESSSVSLDEEASRLVEYQRSYQATSKLISVIDSMTQVLLGLIPTASA